MKTIKILGRHIIRFFILVILGVGITYAENPNKQF